MTFCKQSAARFVLYIVTSFQLARQILCVDIVWRALKKLVALALLSLKQLLCFFLRVS